MRTRKRIHPYVRRELAARVHAYCAAKGITESALVESALEASLSSDERDNDVILRRLNRLGRASARQQRELELLTEGLAVVVQMWFNVAPERSEQERAAGQRLGRVRYQQFLDVVSARIARGSGLATEMTPEEKADDSPTWPGNAPPKASP